MKVLVFDIWSDYAHFRKPYTTTSPLTFAFPPRTVVSGIVGAIIGKPKYDTTCQDNHSSIAIAISSKNGQKTASKKVRIGVNLTDIPKLTGDLKQRGVFELTPDKKVNMIRYEFLKNPCYTIYFHHSNDDIYNTLKHHLEHHTSVYTPYLGISELIANFKYTGEYEFQEIQADNIVDLNSIVPKKYLEGDSLHFDNNGEYFTAVVPNKMDGNRVVQDYIEVIFERNGNPIKAKPIKYWSLQNGRTKNIIFM